MFRRSLTVVFLVLMGQLAAMGAELAVLRNGFSIRHERREQIGSLTRLYTAEGYIDIPTEQIASFEPDDTPQAPPASEQKASEAATTATPQSVSPGSTVPKPQPISARSNASVEELVREASARRQLDPDFVDSVIKAESNFYPRAVSSKGAQGLMQLMPDTAAKLGVRDPFNPKDNVEGGTAYLSELLDLYNNDPIRALAAYNAGPQRVQQYHGVPPYRETQLYIARIVRDFNAKKAKQKAPVMKAQSQEKKKAGSTGVGRQTTTRDKSTSKSKEQQAKLSPPGSTTGAR